MVSAVTDNSYKSVRLKSFFNQFSINTTTWKYVHLLRRAFPLAYLNVYDTVKVPKMFIQSHVPKLTSCERIFCTLTVSLTVQRFNNINNNLPQIYTAFILVSFWRLVRPTVSDLVILQELSIFILSYNWRLASRPFSNFVEWLIQKVFSTQTQGLIRSN